MHWYRWIVVGLLACGAVYAQEKVMTVGANLGAKTQVVPVKDKTTGNYTLVANDRGKLYVWRMGDGFNLANIYEVALNPDHRNVGLIGGMQQEGTLRAYLLKPPSEVLVFTMNVDSGDYAVRVLDLLQSGEHILKTFEQGGAFWILAISETYPGLVVYRSTDGGPFARNQVNVGGLSAKPTDFSLYQYLADRYKNLADVPEIVDDAENPPAITWHPFKAYPKEDKIVLTLDGEGATRLVAISTKDFSVQADAIRYPKVETEAAWKKGNGNSIISHGLLYQAVAGMHELYLRIYDAGNLELIKEHKAAPGRDITFRNGPLLNYDRYKEGDTLSQAYLLKSPEQFYKRLADQPIALSVDDGFERTHVVTIAAVKGVLNGPGVKAGTLPTENVNPDGGVVRAPKGGGFASYEYAPPVYKSYRNRSPRQMALFRTLLDVSTLESMQEKIANPVLDKVTAHERPLLPLLRAQTLINMGWGYVLGYYNTATRAYVLVSFAEER